MQRRRLYWLLIALLFACPAQAQQNVVGSGVYGDVKVSVSSYTGPGDIVAGATAWWGLRAYSSAVASSGTQKAVNLRNINTSETCDILIATSGGLAGTVTNCSGASSGVALSVFCLTACAITKAYDQTGNSNDVSQSTAASQLTITLSCVNSLPCMVGSGSQLLVTSAFTWTSAQPFSFSTTYKGSGPGRLVSGYNGNCGVLYQPGANAIEIFAGNSLNEATTDNIWHAGAGVANGASSIISADGAMNSANTAGTNGTCTVGLGIMSDPGGGNNFTGNMTEGGAWGLTAFSASNIIAICKNEQAYYNATNFSATC